MNEANPLIPLIDEHKIILKVVETLKVYGKNLAPKTELIEEVVDFFKTFADKLHHGK